MTFLTWWEKLNTALATHNQPDTLYGEAKYWFNYRPNWHNLDPAEDRIINQIINSRGPK